MNFSSRAGQDQFLFEYFFRGRRDGVFAEVVASTDPAERNTLFFERFLGWRGVCAASAGALLQGLEAQGLREIDYCSIDARAADLNTLAALDPGRINIRMLSLGGADAEGELSRLMIERGYELVARLGPDQIFKRPDVTRLARTSVICAVWHGDPNRQRLLEGHAANLRKQTVPVEPVYVFDGRDTPPDWLPGHKVVAHENLTIYQAWNVALAMVRTPFVINLNLDDRLAPNAVEVLEAAVQRENAALAGGDWKICYSQEETDAVEPVYPASQLPFTSVWPPPKDSRTRLGSGTGERGTLGPATLWRMDSHIGVPRYPWRFPDGTAIKVIGDLCWWTLLTQHLKKKVVRIGDVIGNYHSHPGEQAEFRGPPNETALMNLIGVSLF